MRTHAQIIKDAGGVSQVREALAKHGLHLPDATVRSWTRRPDDAGSIPPAYWAALSAENLTSLDELALCAAQRVTRGDAA